MITGASSGIGEAAAKRLAREPGAELVLVARREERLRALAESLPCRATHVPLDLTAADAPRGSRDHVAEQHGGRLDAARQQRRRLLARELRRGRATRTSAATWSSTSTPSCGSPRRCCRPCAPRRRRSIVNVASTAGRVARARTGSYSASKFALIGWTDALYSEERANGVHVGMVLPGFIATEGFPATELREKALTRWLVSKPERVADAIVEAGPGGRAERYVPRLYALAAVARVLASGPMRRVLSGGAASALTTSTAEEERAT